MRMMDKNLSCRGLPLPYRYLLPSSFRVVPCALLLRKTNRVVYPLRCVNFCTIELACVGVEFEGTKVHRVRALQHPFWPNVFAVVYAQLPFSVVELYHPTSFRIWYSVVASCLWQLRNFRNIVSIWRHWTPDQGAWQNNVPVRIFGPQLGFLKFHWAAHTWQNFRCQNEQDNSTLLGFASYLKFVAKDSPCYF